MASNYPVEPASLALQPLPALWAPQQEWRWPAGPIPQERSRASPASSPESGHGSLSPADGPPATRHCRQASGPRAKGGRRARLADGQRQSASQREKLRMRRLAGALHTLRRFLPPSLAPADRSLTKIETLRLASRYIAHLSQLLRLARRCPPEPEPEPAACQAWPSPPPCLPPATDTAPWVLGPATDATAASWALSTAVDAAPWALSPATDDTAWPVGPDTAAATSWPLDPAIVVEDAATAAAPPPEDLWAQSLPAELLAWLEGCLSPAAQD